HQVVYVKNDSAFNEAFATAVADEGIKRWLQQRNAPDEFRSWQLLEQRANDFSGLLLNTREKLRTVYSSQQSKATMRAQKQQVLDDLKRDYAQLKQRWNGYAGYDQWFNRPLNNADFIAVATYQQCVPGFERLLHSVDDDLPGFYAAVRTLAHQDRQMRRKLCE
ncbi:MAG: aminopeptidase, partial [Steroidobacter sp.]